MAAENKVRLARKSGFTIIQNGPLRDRRLSLKTKGLFAVLASLPSNWEYSIAGLSSICQVGRDAIRSALKELEEAGYLTRQQEHDEAGHFSGCVYEIREESTKPDPEALATVSSPLSGFPSTGKPSTGNPSSGKPSSGEPTSGNPTVLNKDSIQERSIPPIVPQEGTAAAARQPSRRHRRKSEPAWQAQRFRGFWAAYPRDEERAKAVEQWDAILRDRELMDRHGGDETALLDEISRGLGRHLACREWKEGVGIPHAWRWLRDRRWLEKQKTGGSAEGLQQMTPIPPVEYHMEIIDGEEVLVYGSPGNPPA